MTIIVEDGSIVANANSYVTLEEAREYAKARGKCLTDADDQLEAELVQAMDYLEAMRNRYKGSKVLATQALQWPRGCVTIDGFPQNSAEIPALLKQAQIRIVMEIENGVTIMPTASGDAFIVKEKIGPIETTYSEAVSTSGVPIMRAVDALLAPLLTGGFALTVERA